MALSSTQQKGIIYCRVSSQEQTKGTSLDGQKKACLEYAQSKGITAIKTFVERGESATAANRTELIKALDFCQKNKGNIQAFIVWKIDRFARNTTDHYGLRATLMKYGVNLHSVTEPISDDPIGKMTEAVLAGYAQFENDIRKQRCEGGMQRLLAQGIRPWHPPIGYLHSKNRLERRKTEPDIPDPNRFHLVQRGLKEFSKGNITMAMLTKLYNEWGLATRTEKPMRMQLVDRILPDKFYAGIVVNPWTGEEFAGRHEPMITLEEWRKIQHFKERNANRTNIPHSTLNEDFPLRVFVKCVCGIGLTGSWHKGRYKKYAYYNCRNDACEHCNKNISRLELEQKFLHQLTHYTPNQKFLKLFKEVVIDVWETKHANITQEREYYESRLKQFESKKQQLIQMRMNNEITKEEFMSLKDGIENQITSITISRNEAKTDEFDIETGLSYCTQFIADLPRQWQDMKVEHKVELQHLVFPTGLVYDKTAAQFVGTAVLSPIFALNQTHAKSESDLVAGVGFEPTTCWL